VRAPPRRGAEFRVEPDVPAGGGSLVLARSREPRRPRRVRRRPRDAGARGLAALPERLIAVPVEVHHRADGPPRRRSIASARPPERNDGARGDAPPETERTTREERAPDPH